MKWDKPLSKYFDYHNEIYYVNVYLDRFDEPYLGKLRNSKDIWEEGGGLSLNRIDQKQIVITKKRLKK